MSDVAAVCYSVLVFASCLIFSFSFCDAAAYTNITKTRSLSENDTLVSAKSETFELGFFSLENSSSRYVGIWYRNLTPRTVVWVANRDNPLTSSSSVGTLKIAEDGNLVILQNNDVFWSTNASLSVNDTAAALLSNGDLVLCHVASAGDESKALWQSFDSPTDTYLPGMKVLVNQKTGAENKALVSWKSASDPARGAYALGVDPRGSPQFVIWAGSERRWRSGHWNGLEFVGVPNMSSNYLFGFKLSTEDAAGNMYFTYTPLNASSDLLRFDISVLGYEEQLMYDARSSTWNIMQSMPASECDHYNMCGNFSICSNSGSSGSPTCTCLDGFEAKNSDEWNAGNWSSGCKRRSPLQCEGSNSTLSDGFVTLSNAKLPDFADLGQGANKEACEQACLSDCSCTAYTVGTGYSCLIWKEELVDVQVFSSNGKPLYVRVAGSELGGSGHKLSALAVVAIVLPAAWLILFVFIIWWYRAKLKAYCYRSWGKGDVYSSMKKRRDGSRVDSSGAAENLVGEGKDGAGPELPLFSFSVVSAATDAFSEANLLGKGGFGPVYKGKLPDGQEIAVKRLGGKSGQGFEEFRNEITLIAKLQHRNLVRLIGWCVEGEDKMLIYEFMPNKSLDRFIFNAAKRPELDWKARMAVIEGIARGLLYLHRDSRLRIIHRDLKASNILLDGEMTPKISDFGMARIFGGNQHEANTVRVVGTYGYMSPEYAMEGLFSVKSDVYSFGVLLLEVVSGRRNTSFRLTDYSSLIKYAWSLWTEKRAMELVDESIRGSCDEAEVLRCIQVAMLCVQDSPSYRPNMSTVIIMLESETANLPSPRPPSFTSMRSSIDTEMWTNDGQEQDIVSANDLTLSVVAGR
uniref:Receptor-like serine/threonine-protein kinase n=1 Tax=Kalanchoe fedtschenkoi TaxID=63787 RepID=A0A7N0V106_KALFE